MGTLGDIRDWLERIEALQDAGVMTDWEEEFLESIKGWLTSGKPLTEAQADKLGELEERLS